MIHKRLPYAHKHIYAGGPRAQTEVSSKEKRRVGMLWKRLNLAIGSAARATARRVKSASVHVKNGRTLSTRYMAAGRGEWSGVALRPHIRPVDAAGTSCTGAKRRGQADGRACEDARGGHGKWASAKRSAASAARAYRHITRLDPDSCGQLDC
jgi:hypothetical protein